MAGKKDDDRSILASSPGTVKISFLYVEHTATIKAVIKNGAHSSQISR